MRTDMTPEEWMEAWEFQRRIDLSQARQMRDYYQREVDRLEAADPLRNVSTSNS